ncbi:hypothetical protein Cs7R123_28100 [Catellatospora sp. TT07R-123]|nr:hypothetical protein Cs7R123_28100 [Catellatospora sp. TT07R-123]
MPLQVDVSVLTRRIGKGRLRGPGKPNSSSMESAGGKAMRRIIRMRAGIALAALLVAVVAGLSGIGHSAGSAVPAHPVADGLIWPVPPVHP